MRIILDGHRVSKKCYGVYFKNKAYFTKEGLKKRIVLHELYHHLIGKRDLKMSSRKEENEANSYASSFFKK